ncbi:MAG: Zn-ribbon domain-containing OB-fold protein [Thermodesulfobacteriota bacterium]
MEQKPFNDISYQAYLREEKLMGSKCSSCGSLFVPPRPICVKCGASEMEWVEMKGEGKLSAFTCIAVGPPFMKQEGYTRDHPYCTGVIQLDEGPRVTARIEDIDTKKPEEIKVGTAMKVKYLHRDEGDRGTTFLAFKPL